MPRSVRRLLACATAGALWTGGLGAVAVTTEVAVAAAPAAALDNGLALTPPMGFNDWNAFGCNVSEQLIEQTADYLVSSGLKDAGYTYVNIDDCWMTHTRDADGSLVPDPVKFPDGIKGTADYVHSKGLKLGIYEDAGTEDLRRATPAASATRPPTRRRSRTGAWTTSSTTTATTRATAAARTTSTATPRCATR